VHVMRLPQLGMGMTDADIVTWLVREGDPVQKDSPLVLIDTAKANVELVAPVAGVVRKILVPEGTQVDVGEPIVMIGTADEPLQAG
jgi:2-oxoisovalerate dehydrogenase E2 component (dihydrolipoyl transacylase)